MNWLLNFAKWRLADGGFFFFLFLNQPHAHVVRKQTSECRDFCRCVEGEIYSYVCTDGQVFVCMYPH